MIHAKRRRGFLRSVLVTCSVLAVPALAAAVSSAGLGAFWRLLVFPHAGLAAPVAFPGRPVPLLTYPGAVGTAILQWALLTVGVAWCSKGKELRTQILISILSVIGLSLAVLSLALLSGASLRME